MSVPDDEAAELANDLAIANAQVKWMEAEIESKEIELNAAAEAVIYWRNESERLTALNAELVAALRYYADEGAHSGVFARNAIAKAEEK